MKLHAYMLAFHDPELHGPDVRLREIEIPDVIAKGKSDVELAELAFHYGQNMFQPRELPSVSVGDVIVLPNSLQLVAPAGFKTLPAGTRIRSLIGASRKLACS